MIRAAYISRLEVNSVEYFFKAVVVDLSILVSLKIENISEILAVHCVDLARGLRLHHFKFKLFTYY